jgi:apolipoprotein N-acyltransferase
MDTAVTSKPPQPRHERFLRRVGSVLLWTAVVLLGAFGIYFSFANYPWFGAAVVVLILLLVGYSERKRRATQKARDAERRQHRLSP